jgi:hypothetical protein
MASNHLPLFFRKNAHTAKKFRPNGEISPNLVTLALFELAAIIRRTLALP